MKRYYLAIDIGASSGRHIVGWREDGEIKAKEVYRFPNGVQEQNGHLVWDVDALLSHVKAGIAAAKAEFPEIVSLSVDTWAVDYVLLRGEEESVPSMPTATAARRRPFPRFTKFCRLRSCTPKPAASSSPSTASTSSMPISWRGGWRA